MSEQESKVRTIKKYPNRRLYDTEVSSYITLDDVRKLVLEQAEFRIIDAKSQDDITRSVLLQIILEQEEGGQPIFTEDVLSNIIRFYGDTLQGSLATFLDQSCSFFVDQQAAMREQMSNLLVGDPLNFIRDATEKNMKMWQEMQRNFLGSAAPPNSTRKDDD